MNRKKKHKDKKRANKKDYNFDMYEQTKFVIWLPAVSMAEAILNLISNPAGEAFVACDHAQ